MIPRVICTLFDVYNLESLELVLTDDHKTPLTSILVAEFCFTCCVRD
jgi:hypothetical protein